MFKHLLKNLRPGKQILWKVSSCGEMQTGGRGAAYLEGLVEALDHADPLRRLLSELAGLHLQRLHLVVQLPLVDVGLGHPAAGKTRTCGE